MIASISSSRICSEQHVRGLTKGVKIRYELLDLGFHLHVLGETYIDLLESSIYFHACRGRSYFFYSFPSYFIRLVQFDLIFISMFISLNRICVPLIPYATNF
jgi:hypothetical protein